jgi:hypothetical protein
MKLLYFKTLMYYIVKMDFGEWKNEEGTSAFFRYR